MSFLAGSRSDVVAMALLPSWCSATSFCFKAAKGEHKVGAGFPDRPLEEPHGTSWRLHDLFFLLVVGGSCFHNVEQGATISFALHHDAAKACRRFMGHFWGVSRPASVFQVVMFLAPSYATASNSCGVIGAGSSTLLPHEAARAWLPSDSNIP